ncbi:MAG: flagellar hook-basal body protein, partial [Firmicutes bacterium]|nr:flagellar hook-basal body protein [Bacillota bacterium]
VAVLRGIYASASGLNQQQYELDITANNIANVSTAGFKRNVVSAGSFPAVLLMCLKPGGEVGLLGKSSFGTQVAAQQTRLDQGPLENTVNPRDVALAGSGFLVVDTSSGERYFRGGTLSISTEGYIVTLAGDKVLGEDGPIQAGTSEFKILPDGTVVVGEKPVSKLRVVDFEDKNALIKEGKGYFQSNGPEPVAASTVVQQGYLEGANVDLSCEMPRLIESLRIYQINQRALRAQDEVLSKTLNQVGKVR